jgi:hypothetical protein
VLDGRNRYKACQELGIEMTFCEIEDNEDFDPIAYVLSHNLHRRHLTESQRAMVAAKLAKLQHGHVKSQKDDGQICLSVKEASKMVNASERSTKHAKKVIADGASEVQQAVEQGELPVSVASEFVKAVPDKNEQTKIIEDGVDTVRDAIKSETNGKPFVKVAASTAMSFAQMAILQLERIDIKDPNRSDAFRKVENWIAQQGAPKQNKSGCKNCELLREVLKQAQEDLRAARQQRDDTMKLCSEQVSMISDLVDSKEPVSTVTKRSKQKPTSWLSPQEVVVNR